jgi:hypothetical protein
MDAFPFTVALTVNKSISGVGNEEVIRVMDTIIEKTDGVKA